MSTMIEVTVEAAREILPMLEQQLEQIQQEQDALRYKAGKLTNTIAELKAKLAGGQLPLDGQRQRKPRGHAEEAVETLLASLPGNPGLRMTDIIKRTGVGQSSVFRALRNPKRNQGRFVLEGDLWKLKM